MITLKGIRLDAINLERDKERGDVAIKYATYSLISSTDKVLADQTIGGSYGGDKVKVEPSPTTVKALADFIAAYKDDINTTLGFDAE